MLFDDDGDGGGGGQMPAELGLDAQLELRLGQVGDDIVSGLEGGERSLDLGDVIADENAAEALPRVVGALAEFEDAGQVEMVSRRDLAAVGAGDDGVVALVEELQGEAHVGTGPGREDQRGQHVAGRCLRQPSAGAAVVVVHVGVVEVVHLGAVVRAGQGREVEALRVLVGDDDAGQGEFGVPDVDVGTRKIFERFFAADLGGRRLLNFEFQQ